MAIGRMFSCENQRDRTCAVLWPSPQYGVQHCCYLSKISGYAQLPKVYRLFRQGLTDIPKNQLVKLPSRNTLVTEAIAPPVPHAV